MLIGDFRDLSVILQWGGWSRGVVRESQRVGGREEGKVIAKQIRRKLTSDESFSRYEFSYTISA